jgi:hypothetical protein
VKQKILLALGVALVLGGGVLYLARPVGRGPTAPSASGVVNAPDAPPVDPAPYLTAFPLTAPDIPPVAGTSSVDRALEQALAPMRNGDYNTAATALDGLLLDHPGDPRAQLYLGIARLFQDEPQNALELLRPLEFHAPPDVAAEAAWYSLVGIARLRDPSGVEPEAKTLCESSRATAQRACAALDALRRTRNTR